MILCDTCGQAIEPTNTGTICWKCVNKMLGLGTHKPQEHTMADVDLTNPATRIRLSLEMDMDPDTSGPLSEARRAELEAELSVLQGGSDEDLEGAAALASLGGLGSPTQAVEQHLAPQQDAPDDLQAQLAALTQTVTQLAQSQTQPAVTLKDVLDSLDPRDSDAALALFGWLFDNQRFGVVGTLNGGGYLLHYQEPKGSSQAGYIAGGTQGSRFVDAATEQVKQSGAAPVKRGICDRCFSAVRELESGAIVLDDTENPSPDCSAGGQHTLVA